MKLLKIPENCELVEISVIDEKSKIHLKAYADMLITDGNNCLVAMRFGGYQEYVTAIKNAVISGCTISVNLDGESVFLTAKKADMTSGYHKAEHIGSAG